MTSALVAALASVSGAVRVRFAEGAATPFDAFSAFVNGVVAPVHPDPLSAGELAFVLALASGGIVLACLAFRRVGVTPIESVLLLVVAPLAMHVDQDLYSATPTATIAVNVAGFLVPALVCAKVIVQRRAPFLAVLAALVAGTIAAYASSYAVPDEGVLLYYRVPAIASAGIAVLLAWKHASRVGPLAYVAGAGGVILGADAARLQELLVSDAPHRIVVGGAGVLDGIYLVGILALVLATLGHGAFASLRQAARGEESPAFAEPQGLSRDVGGLG